MKQSQRLRIIVSPTGADGQITLHTTVREIENASLPVRDTFDKLSILWQANKRTTGLTNRCYGWDVQIDLSNR